MRAKSVGLMTILLLLSGSAEAADYFTVKITNGLSTGVGLQTVPSCSNLSCPALTNVSAYSSKNFTVGTTNTSNGYWSFNMGGTIGVTLYACQFFVTVAPGSGGACPTIDGYGWATNGTGSGPSCVDPVAVTQPSGTSCSGGQIEVSIGP